MNLLCIILAGSFVTTMKPARVTPRLIYAPNIYATRRCVEWRTELIIDGMTTQNTQQAGDTQERERMCVCGRRWKRPLSSAIGRVGGYEKS